MNTLHRSTLVVSLVFFIVGCAAPRVYNTVATDVATTQAASTFSPQQGYSKVYFSAGTQGFGAFTDPKIWGGEFFIDGINVGQINQNEVLVIDVIPNTYTFTFSPHNNSDATRQPLTKSLAAGSILILRADLKMGFMGLLLGPLAASGAATLTESEDKRLVIGRGFVAPSNCPVKFCYAASSATLVPASPKVNTGSTLNRTGNNSLQQAENKCKELGFAKGTEKYADCVMSLAN